jgi:hypothetical protein
MHYLIIDIDGTLFNNFHRLHLVPEDMTQVENWTAFNRACLGDSPIIKNIEMVTALIEENIDAYNLIFLTARGMDSAGETYTQLSDYFSAYKVNLCMRAMNDRSTPVDFKRSYLNSLMINLTEISMHNDNTDFTIVDDHSGICAMVRDEFSFINVIEVDSQDCSH